MVAVFDRLPVSILLSVYSHNHHIFDSYLPFNHLTVRNLERTGDCTLRTLVKVAQAMRLENNFTELFKPGIQFIAELAQMAQATAKVRKWAPRKPRYLS